MVRAGIFGGLPLPQLVDISNRYLCETLPMESFVTMVASRSNGHGGCGSDQRRASTAAGRGSGERGRFDASVRREASPGIEEAPMTTVTHQLKPGR